MRASAYGISNLKYILSNLDKWVEDDADLDYRKDIYTGIVYQYFNYILHVFNNIGGINMYEKFDGDPVKNAYKVVDKDVQKRALKFLQKEYEDLDWLDNKALMANIKLMGNPANVLRTAIAQAIVAAPAKVSQADMIDPENAYSVPECMNDIYDYVWNPTIKGGKLTEGQMMLQREYLRLVCSGAGLSYTGNGAAAERGLSDRNITTIEVPELIGGLDLINKNLCYDPACQEHKSIASPVAGYSDPYINYQDRKSVV